MVHLLLNAGANPNAETNKGVTPLIIAGETIGGDPIADLLIQFKADPNPRRPCRSPLHKACEVGVAIILVFYFSFHSDGLPSILTRDSSCRLGICGW